MADEFVPELLRTAGQLGRDLGTAGRTLSDRVRELNEKLGGTSHGFRALDSELAADSRLSLESRRATAPLGPRFAREIYTENGLPDTRISYTKDEYRELFEDRIGRPLDGQEQQALAKGCSGMTTLRLGQSRGGRSRI